MTSAYLSLGYMASSNSKCTQSQPLPSAAIHNQEQLLLKNIASWLVKLNEESMKI